MDDKALTQVAQALSSLLLSSVVYTAGNGSKSVHTVYAVRIDRYIQCAPNIMAFNPDSAPWLAPDRYVVVSPGPGGAQAPEKQSVSPILAIGAPEKVQSKRSRSGARKDRRRSRSRSGPPKDRRRSRSRSEPPQDRRRRSRSVRRPRSGTASLAPQGRRPAAKAPQPPTAGAVAAGADDALLLDSQLGPVLMLEDQTSDMAKQIYIGGLPDNCTKATLETMVVREVGGTCVTKRGPGATRSGHRYYAICMLESEAKANAAIEILHGRKICKGEFILTVQAAKAPPKR